MDLKWGLWTHRNCTYVWLTVNFKFIEVFVFGGLRKGVFSRESLWTAPPNREYCPESDVSRGIWIECIHNWTTAVHGRVLAHILHGASSDYVFHIKSGGKFVSRKGLSCLSFFAATSCATILDQNQAGRRAGNLNQLISYSSVRRDLIIVKILVVIIKFWLWAILPLSLGFEPNGLFFFK